MTDLKLKTINSHAGVARFLAECSEEPCGWIVNTPERASKYAYSLTRPVYEMGDRLVYVREVSHRKYHAMQVDRQEVLYSTDEAAETAAIALKRGA